MNHRTADTIREQQRRAHTLAPTKKSQPKAPKDRRANQGDFVHARTKHARDTRTSYTHTQTDEPGADEQHADERRDPAEQHAQQVRSAVPPRCPVEARRQAQNQEAQEQREEDREPVGVDDPARGGRRRRQQGTGGEANVVTLVPRGGNFGKVGLPSHGMDRLLRPAPSVCAVG